MNRAKRAAPRRAHEASSPLGHAVAAVRASRARTVGFVVAVLIVTFSLVAAGVISALRHRYADQALPGTHLAGRDVSGLTPDGLGAVASEIFDGWSVIFTLDDHTVSARPSEVGLHLDEAATTERALHIRSTESPITAFSERAVKNISLVVEDDQMTALAFIQQAFPELNPEAAGPADASVFFDPAVNAFTTTLGTPGRQLDEAEVLERISSLTVTTTPGWVPLPLVETPPSIDETAAITARDWANTRINLPLSFTVDGAPGPTVDPATIASWITLTPLPDEGRIDAAIDEAAVSAYVTGTLPGIIAPGGTPSVVLRSRDGVVVEVLSEGTPGLGVADPAGVTAAIVSALVTGQPLTQPIALVEAPAPLVDDTTTHWVEVDLSEQMTYLYAGSTPTASFLGSSGTPGNETPSGFFRIWTKQHLTDLAGPDFYYPDVAWQSYFFEDYGFHTAYWHDDFGTPQSHGCINLPEADAHAVYDWVDIGTLVWVHE
ncbi:MAG: L,D-transpeptidase/peptidoglycan binding protein [Propionibacteriaceae bacterium]|jgi:lipoprotein-anchoring transpeptidase ErfK/SrfK|nr:L,D-transpeptidase/peptidoglycan binding protein [Propionibacteriaceae bacterium]